MRLNNFFKFIIAVAVSEMAGVLGALFTTPSIQSGWYAGLIKPTLNPPSWVFGPGWTLLYFLVGVSLYLVWKNDFKVANSFFDPKGRPWNRWSERFWRGDWQKANAIAIFAVQYALNIVWSWVFFGLRQPGAAFFVILALWFSIIYLIINFHRISKPAAWLLLPYILWVTFATYLNYSLWLLN